MFGHWKQVDWTCLAFWVSTYWNVSPSNATVLCFDVDAHNVLLFQAPDNLSKCHDNSTKSSPVPCGTSRNWSVVHSKSSWNALGVLISPRVFWVGMSQSSTKIAWDQLQFQPRQLGKLAYPMTDPITDPLVGKGLPVPWIRSVFWQLLTCFWQNQILTKNSLKKGVEVTKVMTCFEDVH